VLVGLVFLGFILIMVVVLKIVMHHVSASPKVYTDTAP
jgi:hypothetical protein